MDGVAPAEAAKSGEGETASTSCVSEQELDGPLNSDLAVSCVDVDMATATTTISLGEPATRVRAHRRAWRYIMARLRPGSPRKLTREELAERLELKSPGIVEEIHALSLRQIQTEEQRESRLDAKAQGLLVSASLALTVAFTFGGLILQHPEYLDPLQDHVVVLTGEQSVAWAVVALYALALLCGLAASYVAIRALYVRADYQCVDEHVVLAELALRTADDQTGEGAKAAYRRYVAAHYWQIAQHNSDIHNSKADKIKLGQRIFIAFLACLMCIGIALAYAANERLKHPTGPDDKGCIK